jgi:RES domain-containing protein
MTLPRQLVHASAIADAGTLPDSKAVGACRDQGTVTSSIGATRALGDAWLRGGTTALLRVPSVIVPESFNYLLSPARADAGRCQISSALRFPLDPRLR